MESENNEPASKTTRVVIAGHGTFAVGIISAVDQISGKGDLFVPVSSIGLRGVDIDAVLLQTLDENNANILFTDLPAGSCTMSARRLQLAARAGAGDRYQSRNGARIRFPIGGRIRC